jgi:26S proteasome regulatory subunit T3
LTLCDTHFTAIADLTQSVPLTIGSFMEMIDESHGVVSASSGQTYYVRVLSTLDREKLKPNSSVALHRHSHAVVDILPPEADSTIQAMQMTEKPDVSYDDIGGLDMQKQEVREAVELPLSHPELYTQVRRRRRWSRKKGLPAPGGAQHTPPLPPALADRH